MKPRFIIFAIIAAISAAVLHTTLNNISAVTPPAKITLYLRDDSRIETLTFEDYIVGRLFAECPPDMNGQALNAAACAISSTAMFRLSENEKPIFGADFADYTDSYLSPEAASLQYPDGYDTMLPLYKSAAQYGCSHLCTYEGKPIYAPLCRLSAGLTESGGYNWLQPADTSRDRRSDDYTATTACNSEQVRLALKDMCPAAKLNADCSTWFTEPQYLDGGTLHTIKFGGCTISGKSLARAMNLRSTAITVAYTEERFVFTTLGIGENTGMSLYTADKMALTGSTAEDILSYFYKDTVITKV